MSWTAALTVLLMTGFGQSASEGLADAARWERMRRAEADGSAVYTNESFSAQLRPIRGVVGREVAAIETRRGGNLDLSDPALWSENQWRTAFSEAFDSVGRNRLWLDSVERELAELNRRLREAEPDKREPLRGQILQRTEVMARARIALAQAFRDVARLREELQRVDAPLAWGR